jgi:transglutaminase-like putative cysteine protease
MNLAPTVQLSGTHAVYADGLPGIFQTIALMRSLVNQYKTNTDIRSAATTVIFLTPEKNELSEVRALFYYVRDGVRYTKDIHGVETIATPDKTLACKLGDCDDQSTLLATMLESVGYPTRFVIAGYNEPDVMEHVYLQVCACGEWFDLDPTERGDVGYAPPGAVTIYMENIQ